MLIGRAGRLPSGRYDGVSSRSGGKTWMAELTVLGRRRSIGTYPTEEAAAAARDRWGNSLHELESLA